MNKLRKLVDQSLVLYYQSQLRKDQWKDPHQLKEIQFRKLKQIIKHAYEYVPYYHRLFLSERIKPEDIKSQEDLRKIPPVTKQQIQKNYDDFITNGVDERRLSARFTSGSTGLPLKIVEDCSAIRSNYHSALNSYPFFECGVKPSDKFVLISARAHPIMWPKQYTRLIGTIPTISIPLLPDEKLIDVLRQINPHVIWTFPSVLSQLIAHDTLGINPRMIILQGGMVTQDLRMLIKKSLSSEVFETYGSVEFVHLAFECNRHRGLHIITDGAYLEFVDENGEYVSPGEQGEILVTGLWNYTMPLIRYRIGDLGVPTDEKCPCGRSLPLIQNIHGRINDTLVLPNGRKISVAYFYPCLYEEFKKNILSISQYQIVQDRIDRIIFKIVKGKEFDPKTLERIKNNLETFFANEGENMQVVTEIVEDIPLERTGKRRSVISKLN